MNIKEAIKLLSQFPEDYELVISKDSERNSYSPFCDVWQGIYCPENTWSGEVYGSEEEWEEESLGENPSKVYCVVLCPVN